MSKRGKSPKKRSPFLQTCHDLFGTYNLYDVLGISRDATPQEVKKGYHKKSLAVHPDRVGQEDKEIATQKFQALGKAYEYLSDKGRRAEYDETGDICDDGFVHEERDWCENWRLRFPKITVEDLQNFEHKYKESADETEDLKKAYLDAEGDMDAIMGSMLCATFADEPRFMATLKKLIKKGDLPDFPAFTEEPQKKKQARKKKAAKEALEAEVEAKKLSLDCSDSLAALVRKRNKSRAEEADRFFENLEAKYVKQKASHSKTSKKK